MTCLSISYLAFYKNSLTTTVVGLFLFFGIAMPVFAGEAIDDYQVDLHLTNEGVLQVTEKITYDFAGNSQHGIYRDIPLTNVPDDASAFYKERYLDISIQSVLRNGNKEPYKIESSSDEFSVRIGDPDITHSGKQTYVLRYSVSGALVSFTDGPVGIYWNVIGDQWSIPIHKVSVKLTAENGLLVSGVSECYLGFAGSRQSCVELTSAETTGGYSYQNESSLKPHQTVTILQEVDPALVAIKKPERISFWFLLLLVLGMGGVGVSYTIYRFRTKHKIYAPEMVQYEPYSDTRPMYSGLLIDGRLQPRDITAGIVYLAQQGYIKIKAIDTKVLWLFTTKDYEIEKQKNIDAKEYPFLSAVFSLLFADDEKTVKLSELKKNTTKQKVNQKTIRSLKRSLQKELVEKGFYEKPLKKTIQITLPLVIVIVVLLTIVAKLIGIFFPAEYLFLFILGGLLLGVLGFGLYRRLTKKGYLAQNYLRGFRKFLMMTEKERYDFHNDPAKNPEKFMEYLPYAIAFGVEDKWAEVFKDVSIPQPDWYEGDAATSFNAVAFTSSLNNFSDTFSKSSGSVSSTSGSAGGGAGGGGGGSW